MNTHKKEGDMGLVSLPTWQKKSELIIESGAFAYQARPVGFNNTQCVGRMVFVILGVVLFWAGVRTEAEAHRRWFWLRSRSRSRTWGERNLLCEVEGERANGAVNHTFPPTRSILRGGDDDRCHHVVISIITVHQSAEVTTFSNT